MSVRMVKKQSLEVGWARREDDLVGTDREPLGTGEGHVDEALVVKKLAKHAEEVALVIVPSQAVMLTSHC